MTIMMERGVWTADWSFSELGIEVLRAEHELVQRCDDGIEL
jgi:hypothetical protein